MRDCIEGQHKSGKITTEVRDNLMKIIDDVERNLGGPSAEANALSVDIIKTQYSDSFRSKMINIHKQVEILDKINKAADVPLPGVLGKIADKFEKTPANKKVMEYIKIIGNDTAYRSDSLKNEWVQGLNALRDAFPTTFWGELDVSGAQSKANDIIKHLLGEFSDNQNIVTIAKPIRKMLDDIQLAFKRAGAHVGYLENYYPRVHIREKIKNAPFEQWVEDIWKTQDHGKVLDLATQQPVTKERFTEISREIYDDIVNNTRNETDIRNKFYDYLTPTGPDIGYRRSTSQFFKFTPEGFIEYNAKYGVGEDKALKLLFDYVDSAARDLGIIEKLGPGAIKNHGHVMRQLKAEGADINLRKWADGIMDTATGAMDHIENADSLAWDFFTGAQNLVSAGLTGAAATSALSDVLYVGLVARMNGLGVTGSLKFYFKHLTTALGKNTKREAIAQGWLAQEALNTAVRHSRLTGNIIKGGFTRDLANLTFKAGGLDFMTRLGAATANQGFEIRLAQFVDDGIEFNKLPKAFLDSAKKHGITEQDWEVIKNTDILKHPVNGVRFLRGHSIINSSYGDFIQRREASRKILDWMAEARFMATNEPTYVTRSITKGAALFGKAAQPGTLPAYLIRSGSMFYSFPVSVMMNHTIPRLGEALGGNLKPIMQMAVAGTIIGTMIVQWKQIEKGKKLKDWDDPNLWKQGMLHAGFLGPLGDAIFGEDYSRGKPAWVQLSGPMGALAYQNGKNVVDFFDAVGDGKETQFLSDTLKANKILAPPIRLWYNKTIIERLLLDQVEKVLNPNFEIDRLRQENYLNRNNEEMFWRRGDVLPEESPLAENIFPDEVEEYLAATDFKDEVSQDVVKEMIAATGYKRPGQEPGLTLAASGQTPEQEAKQITSILKARGLPENKVIWSEVDRFEGGLKTEPYIPKNAKGELEGGVTIGVGVDLGWRTYDELKNLGVPKKIREKIKPFLAKGQGKPVLNKAAQKVLDANKGISLTKTEAETLTRIIKSDMTKKAIKYTSEQSNIPFSKHPPEAQTVITSIAYQWGDIEKRRREKNKFPEKYNKNIDDSWELLMAGKYKDAARVLKKAKQHTWRRGEEAKLLEKIKD